MIMTATGPFATPENACPSCWTSNTEPSRLSGHTCGEYPVQPTTDLTALLAALAPFLRCEAGKKGGSCWPRCDGPERRVLVEAVERIKEAQCQPR